MVKGYAGKLLEVDLSENRISDVVLEEKLLKEYIGGRGLAAKILWDRLGEKWRSVDPLGPENLLLILTGPITGYITGTRICVSGKSPGSNGIVGSTVSGEFPMELKCAGFDGVIVGGKAEKPVYLLITDGSVEIRDAGGFWGLRAKETIRGINREVIQLFEEREKGYGEWKEPAMIYIGPSGENLVRTAAVCQKISHAAGYGGYGAVMGSKNLKAIVAKATGPLPEVSAPEQIRPMLEQFYNAALGFESLRRWGTGAGGYNTGAVTSSEPQRNWQEEYHKERSISVVNFETKTWVKRYWSDYGCPTSCMKLAAIKTGPYKGAITDNPDYELQAYCGTNLGIYDAEGVVYVSAEVDDLGLSGINSANTMGFAAELFQRGILTKEDFDGIEPQWGDPKAMVELAQLISERRYVGNILAEGTYRAAVTLGQMKNMDLLKYAVQAKGIETGGHSPRSGLGYMSPLGYAVGTQGGDHTSSASHRPGGEIPRTIGDSLVFCTASLGWQYNPQTLWPFFKAVTGWDMDDEMWWNEVGRRIIMIQRTALLLGGPDVVWKPIEDDVLPPRFYTPLPTGPKAGSAIDMDTFKEMRSKYFEEMGWDERGIPKSEELVKLGLEDVDRVLQKEIR